jgi:hypothetical protein
MAIALPILASVTGEIFCPFTDGGTAARFSSDDEIAIPTLIVPPALVQASAAVGDVITVTKGQWTLNAEPLTSIGTGTGASFNPLIATNALFGTVPLAMLGQEITIREQASVFGGGTATTYVSSGVTVTAGAEEDFPSPINAGLWACVEVRDAAPAGRRRFTIQGSVVVPSGFTLRGWAGPIDYTVNPGAVATDSATFALTPGTAYTTTGTMPLGLTCFALPFWRRDSDGAYSPACVPATEQLSFTILGLEGGTNPPDPGFGDSPVPDIVISSSVAAVRAQAFAWENVGSPKCIGIGATLTGELDLSGLNAGHEITIRHYGGTYTDTGGCSIWLDGRIKLHNASNIRITRMFIKGIKPGGTVSQYGSCIESDSSQNIRIDRNWCDPSPFATGADTEVAAGYYRSFSIMIVNSRNITVEYNYGWKHEDAFCKLNGATSFDCKIIGNMVGRHGHDNYKVNNATNLLMRYNWGSRHESGGASHTDWMQCSNGGVHNGTRWERNVLASGQGTSWWNGNTGSEKFLWFEGGTAANNCTVTQNIYIGDNGFNSYPMNNFGNFLCHTGTNGSIYTTGGTSQSACFVNNTNQLAGNIGGLTVAMTGYNATPFAGYFDGGIPGMNSACVPTDPPSAFSAWKPKNDPASDFGRMHWSHPNALPVASFFRYIFEASYRATEIETSGECGVPGDLGWPIAYWWMAHYNHNKAISTAYGTGTIGSRSYDAHGNYA